MKNIILFISIGLFLTGCFKGDGEVGVSANKSGAIIYVDNDKKGMVGDGYTMLKLSEGEHTIRIFKHTEEWDYEGTKDIFVGANTSVKINISMNSKPTKYRLARLEKENIKRIAKEKIIYFIDNINGIMWQDNNKIIMDSITWYEANTYCNNLILDNFTNWRLPNESELKSANKFIHKSHLQIHKKAHNLVHFS